MIFAWWPPVPADYKAYADAGFNIALTRPDVYCDAKVSAVLPGAGRDHSVFCPVH